MPVISSAGLASNVGLSVFSKIAQVWRTAGAAMSTKNLIDATKGARVEPTVLLDIDTQHYEHIQDILQSLQNQFAGYYLQAVQIDGNVGSINIVKQLEKFNPNRDAQFASVSPSWMLATESFKDRLPTPIDNAAMESFDRGAMNSYNEARMAHALEAEQISIQNAAKDISDSANLSIGKLLNVEFKDPQNAENKVTIPVALRLMVTSVSSQRLAHILSIGAEEDMSASDRYYAWKAGKLDFIRDIILCQDKIELAKKRMLQDRDGLYSAIVNKRNKSRLAAVISGVPSIGAASAIVIMSSTTAEMLERELLGKLKDFRTRQKVFENTSAMILAIVDKSWGKVTFYYSGMNDSNTVDVRSLKGNTKGPDIGEVLKAFTMGSAPTIR